MKIGENAPVEKQHQKQAIPKLPHVRAAASIASVRSSSETCIVLKRVTCENRGERTGETATEVGYYY